MLDVLMMVHIMGTLLPSDNDRFSYIAKKLASQGAKVELITSDFNHHQKEYRNRKVASEWPFKVTFIHENLYEKNISFGRIKGHISFAKRLENYLNNRTKPDVIYCAIPPTVSAAVTAKYAERKSIPLVIDVQDLWPESFVIALRKNNKLTRGLFLPIKHFADKAYSSADVIFAVSNTFLKRAIQVNTKTKKAYSVFLGTDGKQSDAAMNRIPQIANQVKDNTFKIAYVGNFGKSYDFDHLIEAVSIIRKYGKKNLTIYFIGDGKEKEAIKEKCKKNNVDYLITGYLPYGDMLYYLKQCDIAVNPIKKTSVSSIVNKVGDYAWAGIPVINNQTSEEYRTLLSEYNAGISVPPENSESMAEAIEILYNDTCLRMEMGQNNRKLFEDLFDRGKSYNVLITEILEMAEEKAAKIGKSDGGGL